MNGLKEAAHGIMTIRTAHIEMSPNFAPQTIDTFLFFSLIIWWYFIQ